MTIRTGDPSRASRAVPDDQPDRNPSLSAIHKTVARLALALVLASAVPAGAAAAVDPTRSVVKVYVATIGRDVASPWRPGSNFNVTGSGAVIAGRRILTAAHVVDDQTLVQVRRNGTTRKFTAKVAFVSHWADLALLEVDDPAFFEGAPALELGELPATQQQVAALGFPNGGETLSITAGVVARVEDETYLHGGQRLLAIQMDAAIAPGSSGGPLVRDGKVVGVAMQGFVGSSIGSAVAVPVIRQFLGDVADGRLDGIPSLGLRWQQLESGSLRASLGVPAAAGGVLVTGTVPRSPAARLLRPGDVLLSLGGRAIAEDGTVELRAAERTDFTFVADQRQLGDVVAVRYLRDGKVAEADLSLSLARGDCRLVPHLFDRAPDYFLYAGLAFVPLTDNLLAALGYQPALLTAQLWRDPDSDGQEVVVLIDILRHDVNSGYDDRIGQIVRSVDGVPVRNLAHLVTLVEKAQGQFVTFTDATGSRIVIDRARAAAAAGEILARYAISADRSPRLVAAVERSAERPQQARDGKPVLGASR
jgi:S1-C subfamily serine protease